MSGTVCQRTDRHACSNDHGRMRNLLAIAAFALIVAAPTVQAQVGREAAQRFAAGQAMEHSKDEKGAFFAYLEAAEAGHPPAQRRLGEIYDSGNSAVKRDYEESIRWYQKAREGGEQIPPPKSPFPDLVTP
jgi:TPR repeat protein